MPILSIHRRPFDNILIEMNHTACSSKHSRQHFIRHMRHMHLPHISLLQAFSRLAGLILQRLDRYLIACMIQAAVRIVQAGRRARMEHNIRRSRRRHRLLDILHIIPKLLLDILMQDLRQTTEPIPGLQRSALGLFGLRHDIAVITGCKQLVLRPIIPGLYDTVMVRLENLTDLALNRAEAGCILPIQHLGLIPNDAHIVDHHVLRIDLAGCLPQRINDRIQHRLHVYRILGQLLHRTSRLRIETQHLILDRTGLKIVAAQLIAGKLQRPHGRYQVILITGHAIRRLHKRSHQCRRKAHAVSIRFKLAEHQIHIVTQMGADILLRRADIPVGILCRIILRTHTHHSVFSRAQILFSIIAAHIQRFHQTVKRMIPVHTALRLEQLLPATQHVPIRQLDRRNRRVTGQNRHIIFLRMLLMFLHQIIDVDLLLKVRPGRIHSLTQESFRRILRREIHMSLAMIVAGLHEQIDIVRTTVLHRHIRIRRRAVHSRQPQLAILGRTEIRRPACRCRVLRIAFDLVFARSAYRTLQGTSLRSPVNRTAHAVQNDILGIFDGRTVFLFHRIALRTHIHAVTIVIHTTDIQTVIPFRTGRIGQTNRHLRIADHSFQLSRPLVRLDRIRDTAIAEHLQDRHAVVRHLRRHTLTLRHRFHPTAGNLKLLIRHELTQAGHAGYVGNRRHRTRRLKMPGRAAHILRRTTHGNRSLRIVLTQLELDLLELDILLMLLSKRRICHLESVFSIRALHLHQQVLRLGIHDLCAMLQHRLTHRELLVKRRTRNRIHAILEFHAVCQTVLLTYRTHDGNTGNDIPLSTIAVIRLCRGRAVFPRRIVRQTRPHDLHQRLTYCVRRNICHIHGHFVPVLVQHGNLLPGGIALLHQRPRLNLLQPLIVQRAALTGSNIRTIARITNMNVVVLDHTGKDIFIHILIDTEINAALLSHSNRSLPLHIQKENTFLLYP